MVVAVAVVEGVVTDEVLPLGTPEEDVDDVFLSAAIVEL